ncbi:MAG: YifB family Mg chelatase-like AAA ATPase [Planctomycetota bacterium]
MLSRIHSFLLAGVDAERCEVEVDLDESGLTKETIVGLPDAAVKESLERVRSALTNTGYAWPMGRVLINLAPADQRKEGPAYDLPIAVGLLAASGVLSGSSAVDLRSAMVAGELALDGRVRPIKGALAMASCARASGLRTVIVPEANASEASVVDGVEALGVSTLAELVGVLRGDLELEASAPPDIEGLLGSASAPVDFAEVRGQEAVKRAVMIAAAGGHNLLMLGPAGSGKTMMAKALPGILPALTPEEAIEITRIYSVAGALEPGRGLLTMRPVRSPHHTSSAAAVVGGGVIPRPGEISLAHRGVLFLDELPEFPRAVLETLRQPLEDHVVTVARSQATVRFPADFMLVAAMNPTPKGDAGMAGAGEAGRRAQERYLSRLSGPLLDRIDVHVEAPAVPWEQLRAAAPGTGTAAMRERVATARGRQRARQGAGVVNARLSGKQLDELAPMSEAGESLLGRALQELGLSARAYDKIRRVARTIADLDGVEGLDTGPIAEAIGYRLLDRRV